MGQLLIATRTSTSYLRALIYPALRTRGNLLLLAAVMFNLRYRLIKRYNSKKKEQRSLFIKLSDKIKKQWAYKINKVSRVRKKGAHVHEAPSFYFIPFFSLPSRPACDTNFTAHSYIESAAAAAAAARVKRFNRLSRGRRFFSQPESSSARPRAREGNGFDRRLYKATRERYFAFYFAGRARERESKSGLDTDVNSTRCNAL